MCSSDLTRLFLRLCTCCETARFGLLGVVTNVRFALFLFAIPNDYSMQRRPSSTVSMSKQLAQEDVVALKKALVENTNPVDGLMADLGVRHFHKPFFRIKIPLGASDVRHTRDAVAEDAIPSVVEFCQRRKSTRSGSVSSPRSRTYKEVMQLSRKVSEPLLGTLRCVSLGDMQALQTYLASVKDRKSVV